MTVIFNTTADIADQNKLLSKLQELNTFTVNMGDEIVTYVDGELSALNARVNLLDAAAVTASLAKVEAFLTAVDPDGDNVIDQVAALLTSVSALTGRVSTLETDLAALTARVAANETAISSLNTSVAGLTGDVADHENRVGSLEAWRAAFVDDAGLTEAEVEAISAAVTRSGIKALVDHVAAFTLPALSLGFTYPITNAGEGGGGTGGIA